MNILELHNLIRDRGLIVSEATLRDSDLLHSFALILGGIEKDECQALSEEAFKILKTYGDFGYVAYLRTQAEQQRQQMLDAQYKIVSALGMSSSKELLEELDQVNQDIETARIMLETCDYIEWLYQEDMFDMLNAIAPEGYYFGSHPGDGACFGYWEYDDDED